jgi:hypothetical protein
VVLALVVAAMVAWSFTGRAFRAKLVVEDGRLMTRIIENGFIVNIFFFEEWTASFFVHCLGLVDS